MKFLVLWRMELSLLSAEMAAAVGRMPGCAGPLEERGQVAVRYHLVGGNARSTGEEWYR